MSSLQMKARETNERLNTTHSPSRFHLRAWLSSFTKPSERHNTRKKERELMTKAEIRELVRELIRLEKQGTLRDDYKMPKLTVNESVYFCELLEMATYAIEIAQGKGN